MSHNTDLLLRALLSETCALPFSCRFLAVTLAQLADWRTGRGIAGQGRLARAMGCDVRTVQRLKRQLAEAAEASPVTVTWRHRKRLDGLNGSDAYTITLRVHPTSLQVHPTDCPAHPTDCRTNITTGVPTGGHPSTRKESENSFKGYGPLDQPNLIGEWWAPNATHLSSAKRLGVSLGAAAASFVAWHAPRGELRTRQGWDRAFGGWLKRNEAAAQGPAAQAAHAAQQAADKAAAEAAELAAFLAK